MANTLFNTTTFSGADTTIIAYRRNETPAAQFGLNERRRELEEVNRELGEINLSIEEEKGFSSPSTASSNAELRDSFTKTKEPSLAFTAEGIGRSEGRFQNNNTGGIQSGTMLDLQQRQSFSVSRIRELESEIAAMEDLAYIQFSNLHTITYSSFREKFAVRALGRTHAKAYTRGPRTIAGTIIFNTTQEQELMSLADPKFLSDSDITYHPNAVMTDQIDPFNLLLLFANEYGAYSTIHLFNVEIASEGQEMSIETLLTQNSFNFYATDIVPMTSLGNMFTTYNDMVANVISSSLSASRIESKDLNLKQRHVPDIYFNNPFKQNNTLIGEMLSDSRGLF